MKYITGEEVISIAEPGQRVFSHGGAATPPPDAHRLRGNVDIASIRGNSWSAKRPNDPILMSLN